MATARWRLFGAAQALGVFAAAMAIHARDAGPAPPGVGMPEKAAAESPDAGVSIVGAIDEALGRLAAERNEEARRLIRRKDFPAALARLREAVEMDPSSAEIANNLAYLYALLGNHAEAERFYRRALALEPDRFVAHLNLADLLGRKGETPERLAEAANLLSRARELKGNQPKIILRQARVAALRGLFSDAERFYQEYLARAKADDALRLELGDFFRDLGREEEALSWYRQIADTGETGDAAARRIWDLEVERQARRFGWTRRPEAVPAQARVLAARGRVLLDQGKNAEAERLLLDALALAPAFAAARADLGDLYRRSGRPAEAELSYLRAIAVDHGDAGIHARLGDFYLELPEPRPAEAAIFLSRALEIRPDWADVHLKLARALRLSGDLARALEHVDRFLVRAAPGEARDEAMALRAEIAALVPNADSLGEHEVVRPAGDVALDREIMDALGRARAHIARGETDVAMAELRRLSDQARGTEVLNLEGRILHSVGRLDEAAEALGESLALDANQAEAHEELGVILDAKGDRERARMQLERAVQLGATGALFHLARLEAGDGEAGWFSWARDIFRLPDLIEANRLLERFFDRGSESMLTDKAKRLEARVASRLETVIVAATLLVAIIVSVFVTFGVKRWGGGDLARFLAKRPDAAPDVQRVLSAIRHEVLKHNTMALTGLAESIERGDPDAPEKGVYLKRTLLGEGERPGALHAFEGYVAELETIGRAHGQRLNLKRRDRAISAIAKGLGLVESEAARLEAVGTLDGDERARLARTLGRAARSLNVDGYETVNALLDRLRLLDVDEALLTSIFERTRLEPAFASARFAPLVLDIRVDGACRVLVPRRAFEDILANLLRNAIRSSLDTGILEVAIGISVRSDVEPVTGIERVRFLVLDRSPRPLPPERLRDRRIEDGLGLTVELASRYDGGIDVMPGEGGWSKAVRVSFPRA